MSVLNEQIRKLVPGGFRGDRAVQPGQHVVILPGPPAAPAAASVCIAGVPIEATETFDKADGAPGPVLPWLWPPTAPHYGATGPTPFNVRSNVIGGHGYVDCGLLLGPDQSVEITIVTAEFSGANRSVHSLAFALRANAGLTNLYSLTVGANGGNTLWQIEKLVASTLSSIASATHATPVPGDVIGFSVIGIALTATLNSTTVVAGTDSSLASGKHVNLIFQNGTSAPPFIEADNFRIIGTTECPPP